MTQRLIIDGCLHRSGFTLEVQLDIGLDEAVGLQGATGAGKTTLLRIIAGLEPGFIGHLQYGDSVWHESAKGVSLPAHLRRLGVVFQDARLLPGRTVQHNLVFAVQRSPSKFTDLQLATLVRDFYIDGLLDQQVDTLSGGERQRVSLAQALLTRPQLLLLDEPLSANDSDHRWQVAARLSDWLREQELPLIYVSHSADELHLLTRKILKLEAGQIVAQGPTSDMLKMISGHASFPATVLEVNETSGRVMLRLEQPRGISGIAGLSPGDRICVSHQLEQALDVGASLQPKTQQNEQETD